MLAGRREDPPEVDHLRAIEMERLHGGPTGRREPDDEARVLVPGEMIAPPLTARVEQRGGPAGRRIRPLDMIILMMIASLARQGQVILGRGAAPAARDDVLGRERLHGEPRLAAAILAAAGGEPPDVSLQVGGDAL